MENLEMKRKIIDELSKKVEQAIEDYFFSTETPAFILEKKYVIKRGCSGLIRQDIFEAEDTIELNALLSKGKFKCFWDLSKKKKDELYEQYEVECYCVECPALETHICHRSKFLPQ